MLRNWTANFDGKMNEFRSAIATVKSTRVDPVLALGKNGLGWVPSLWPLFWHACCVYGVCVSFGMPRSALLPRWCKLLPQGSRAVTSDLACCHEE